jgi:hypothetical protein
MPSAHRGVGGRDAVWHSPLILILVLTSTLFPRLFLVRDILDTGHDKNTARHSIDAALAPYTVGILPSYPCYLHVIYMSLRHRRR